MATDREVAAKELEDARQHARELERAGKLTQADVDRVKDADINYTRTTRNAQQLTHNISPVPGVTYRQLDHWVRRGWLRPHNPNPGSGYVLVWPAGELRVAEWMGRLVAAGLAHDVAHRIARGDTILGAGISIILDRSVHRGHHHLPRRGVAAGCGVRAVAVPRRRCAVHARRLVVRMRQAGVHTPPPLPARVWWLSRRRSVTPAWRGRNGNGIRNG